MEAGTFGLCETCHDPIEADRLAADPLLRRCIDHLTAGERRVLEQDLELASRIQLGLLPPREVSALGWEIAYHFEPYGHVGGDYCDIVRPDPHGDSLFFLVGDVSGKGVAASLLLSNLLATIRSLMSPGLTSDGLMTRANRLFCQHTLDAHYATLACGRSLASGEVELCSAGHWPVARASRPGAVHRVVRPGVDVLQQRRPATTATRSAFPGAYTDGLTEARNPAGEYYAADRLARLTALAGRSRRSPRRWRRHDATPARRPDVHDLIMVVRRMEPEARLCVRRVFLEAVEQRLARVPPAFRRCGWPFSTVKGDGALSAEKLDSRAICAVKGNRRLPTS
jgi:sigma-B regulation protein RsbU (phosphoserine phosphatase)